MNLKDYVEHTYKEFQGFENHQKTCKKKKKTKKHYNTMMMEKLVVKPDVPASNHRSKNKLGDKKLVVKQGIPKFKTQGVKNRNLKAEIKGHNIVCDYLDDIQVPITHKPTKSALAYQVEEHLASLWLSPKICCF